MWDQASYDTPYGGGGGFMNTPGAGATPGGGAGGAKRHRAQTVVPVHIREITGCAEETLLIEGKEVGMVVVVGQVKSIDHQATKTTYTITDDTGSIEALLWLEEGQDTSASSVSEGMTARVVGAFRSTNDKRHIMVFKITAVDDPDDVDLHKLEVLHAKLKIRQLQEKENMTIGANVSSSSNSGLSNSMVGGSMGAQQMSSTSFGNPKHEMVHNMILGCKREEGLNRDELVSQLKGKVNKPDIDSALEFLSSEGHIYSTIDDDHFKTIDG